jgi:hypothetical protein
MAEAAARRGGAAATGGGVTTAVAAAAGGVTTASPTIHSTIHSTPTTPDIRAADTNREAAATNRETHSTTDKHAAKVGPLTPPDPVRQHFQVGANVNAEWRRGKWFLGQVTGFDNGRYTVYFLFGKVKPNLLPSQVRDSDSRYPRRSEMVRKDFFFDGAPDLPEGTWRVRQVLGKENMYKCTRITGGDPKDIEKFDIGYVIKQYMQEADQLRESGLGTVLTTRTRCSEGSSR